MNLDTLDFFKTRSLISNQRLSQFTEALRSQIASDDVLGEGTCVYVVGSGGREEIGAHSDLDIFLVSQQEPSRIQEVLLQAGIIRALRGTGFPDPDGGGRFLQLHHAPRLVEKLGAPTDDTENTFTARMLLLLESKPLLGQSAYEELIDACLGAYWKNEREGRGYLPMVLVNDIVRYWRIVLLNYESRHASDIRKECANNPNESYAQVEARLQPKKWAKGIKLRFARCMSCFSLITPLLAEVKTHGTVERSAARQLLNQTPVERLISLAGSHPEVAPLVDELLGLYAGFLRVGEAEKNGIEALMRATDATAGKQLFRQADRFAELFFHLAQKLGEDNPLFRYLVV